MKIELFNEDCEKTLGRLEDGSIDLLLQDTPFGVTQNDWDKKPDLQRMWIHWERVIKDDGAIIFFATQPFASELIMSKRGLFRYDLIWLKSHDTGFLNAQKMPLRSHEHILVFYKKLPVYNPQLRDKPPKNIRPISKGDRKTDNYGKFKNGNHRTIPINKEYPKSIWYCQNESKTSTIHTTQKPVKLIRQLVKSYSNQGETVFDGYSGSGTTAIACILENRNFKGSEIVTDIYKQADERIENALAQQSLFPV